MRFSWLVLGLVCLIIGILLSFGNPMTADYPIQKLGDDKIKGLAFVAPPKPFLDDPMQSIAELGGNWVSLHPYGFFKKNQASIQYNSNYQWWGERPEGIARSIELAHQQDLKVLLKPQLWTYNQWIGSLDFDSPAAAKNWQQNYEDFILPFAKMADSLAVEMFCVGTEIKQVALQYPDYWRQLIAKIRKVYKGKLTYAANWDSWEKISFWEELDYIGVDAYFPLHQGKTASVKQLKRAWQPILKRLEQLHQKYQKPILFAEFGYMSVDDCAYQHWKIEQEKGTRAVNEQAQANAIQAVFEVFGNKDWWAGGFLWKWYPSPKSNLGEGSFQKDYTPQGKKAERVLKDFFSE